MLWRFAKKEKHEAELLPALTHVQMHHVNETLTRLVYQKAVKPGDHVLDVGAHMGQHTAPLSQLVGESGLVHAFEPDIAHLKTLTSIAKNVRIWPFAAGNQMSLQQLHIPAGLDGWASLQDIRQELPDRKFTILSTVQIPVDLVLSEIDAPRVSFIKIDVERRELEAIEGMTELLKQSRAILTLENANHSIKGALNKVDYDIIEFNGTGWIEGHVYLANSMGVPREKLPQIDRWLPTAEEIKQMVIEAMR
jgi:FkbM family methyltransferase